MALREILLWPDPRLSEPCAPVGDDIPHELIADMFETMYAAPGRGLAAPQVGVMRRLFVTETTWKEGQRSPRVFIDPEIVSASDETATNQEGCLSIPGAPLAVTRPARVVLRFRDETGAPREEAFEGFAAACVQHELDHLDGRVIFDRVSDEARAAGEAAYREARGA